MKILDHFGNEMEVGDTIYCSHNGNEYILSNIKPLSASQLLTLKNPSSGEICEYLVFNEDPVAKDLLLDVTKKDKEGALKYHLLNSQIDGGS